MEKITSVLRNNNAKQSYFSLVFGKKICDNCFDFNFTEEDYLNFLRFIKNDNSWELLSKKNIKVFYYIDLKLTVDDIGNLSLSKDVLLNYHDFLNKKNEGVRLLIHKRYKEMDLNIFPGLDKINDIRKMREIIFMKNNVYIKFLVVSHVNKEITFESIIYSDLENKKNLLKELPNILKWFKFMDLSIYFERNMNNKDKMSISIL